MYARLIGGVRAILLTLNRWRANAGNHDRPDGRDKARWTYFGDAFFNVALRQTKNLKEAFDVAHTIVEKRELREHFESSNPRMAGGADVQALLIAHP
jgi:hypothetical protein